MESHHRAAPPAVTATALWYVDRGRAELRTVSLPQSADHAVVRAQWSGISRGTERLVFEGRVPPSEIRTMRAPLQDGDFPFPVKYGYCAVGRVERGPRELEGRNAFALHPHQDVFALAPEWLLPIPDGVPARRAILAANMETALNALWDSGTAPGNRIAVVGAGVVGLLVAYLCARIPGAEVVVSDVAAERETVARTLGVAFAAPAALPDNADVVFHTSASAAGLATAIAAAGNEATVVEMSWYGDGTIAVPLGGAFHSRRLRIVSSQVGQVAPSHRGRWTHRRRLAKALALLADPRLDALITNEVAFADLPSALPRLLAAGAPGLATAVRY